MALHKRQREKWALAAILLLAFCLRLFRLGAESLWYDETISVHLAGKSLPELVAHTVGDIHPPAYYILLHGWLRLGGDSDFSAAFFSLFFGQLLVALVYRLGARLWDRSTGLLAALLVALSPYHLWYSQEVRMYTLAAALAVGLVGSAAGLLSLGSATPRRSTGWSATYVTCAVLGLWTLYYFAFLLTAVNLMAGAWWIGAKLRRRVGWVWLGRWAALQAVALALYVPWIPVAWRQATAPPVPPWREFTGLGKVLIETWSALSLGQSVEPKSVWPVLVLVAILFLLGLMGQAASGRSESARALCGAAGWHRRWFLAGTVLLPVLLIYLASFVTPLYHVRYAFTYSAGFYIIVAAGLAWLGSCWRPGLVLVLAAIAAFCGASMLAFHTDPCFTSDDHRAATQFLAEHWRPGDAILVHAGYAYPAFVTYWDGDPIVRRERLVSDVGQQITTGPVLLQAGTVDGDVSLGWGSPESDFYAMSRAETATALQRLFRDYHRVWLYRIYDTVTDPEGFVRRWLLENGIQFEDRVFAGESQLRVQGFLTGRDPLADMVNPVGRKLADGSLQLLASTSLPREVRVGESLDVALLWQISAPASDDMILFAGLFDEIGRRWAQTDERPLGTLYPTSAWSSGSLVRTPLRIRIPVDTPLGYYRLEIGWYRFQAGQPVWVSWTEGDRLALGGMSVAAPPNWWALPEPPVAQPVDVALGRVKLLGFNAQSLESYAGNLLELELVWQNLEEAPGPGLAVLQLCDDSGTLLTEAAAGPVGGRSPFVSMVTGQIVRDPRGLVLPADLPPGSYNLTVGRRSSDGTWLPVARGIFSLGGTYPLATIRVLDRSVDLTAPAVQHPIEVRFGEGIRLIGYDLQRGLSELELLLYWQALEPIAAQYKVFVHLVAEGDPTDIRAQGDIYPAVPTASWEPGEYLQDTVRLSALQSSDGDCVDLLMGIYDEEEGVRLPVSDATGVLLGDSILLERLCPGE